MRWCAVLGLTLLLCACGFAQRHSIALSEAEEEEVRDAAAVPAERILVYQKATLSRASSR